MLNKVITIGRQFGSGGHEIGIKLAKKHDVPFYDQELLIMAAEKTGYDKDYLEKIDETAPSIFSGPFISGLNVTSYYHQSPTDKVFVTQCKILQEIASKGPCVIVGRVADYVLREMDVINIFLHANIEFRVKRKLSFRDEHDEPLTAKKMEKHIYEIDKKRAKYYEYYTDEKWGANPNYHLSLDTSLVGIDGAVNVISSYIENLK